MNNQDTEINFIKTEDGSTGLYNKRVDDIYHSKSGAKKEAVEKFVLPSGLDYCEKLNRKIEILDICYGIGYNTKSILNYSKSKNINITCLDTDKSLAVLSPFINDKIDDNELKVFLIESLLKNNIADYEIIDILNKSYINENIQFFTDATMNFKALLLNVPYRSIGQAHKNQNLHNIYYNYISDSMEYNLNTSKYNDCNIDFIFGDARQSIKSINKKFDIIFLDAFSPQKSPSLWTIEFLSRLKSLMHNNSVFATYSKSTPVRSALYELGFSLKKTFIDGIDMGTSASLNNNLVISNLTDFDFQLFKTKSGIFFHDDTLSHSDSEILKLRESEQKSSGRISHTKFLQKYY